jgi:hypothetical protein
MFPVNCDLSRYGIRIRRSGPATPKAIEPTCHSPGAQLHKGLIDLNDVNSGLWGFAGTEDR